MTETIEQNIINYAQTVERFTASHYVQDCAITIVSALQWRSIQNALSRLVIKGKLLRIQKGIYTLARHNAWQVVLGEQEKSVYNLIHEQYPLIRLCVYNGETFAPIQHHLAFNQATYIEVDRDSAESVFHRLQDAGYEAYCCPDEQMAYNYADIKKKIVIVKPLVSQAPLMKQNGYYVPTLEKLIVDIRVDKDFYYMHGIEATYMTDMARQLYIVNEAKLKRYAMRRGVKL